MEKKKILVLATGGTIASAPSPDGLVPALDVNALLRGIDEITDNYEITAKDILNLDSSNIQPEEWVLIAQKVYEAVNGKKQYDGIVVTHGTDTMAYTASILSFMLAGVHKPIVLTGSQLPIMNPLTDAAENLRYALAMAASGVPGVFVAFNRKIILGCRAVKVRTTGFDAFESVNYPYIAKGGAVGLEFNPEAVAGRGLFYSDSLSAEKEFVKSAMDPSHGSAGHFSLKDTICNDVFLIKLTPGLNPTIFDMLLEMKYKGIVIEAFGAGGLHYVNRDLISKLEKLVQAGIPVVVSSQCLYERSDMSIYEVGKKALEHGVISAFDMTTEAAVTKLIWTLGQAKDMEEIRKYFATNLVGEISI